MRHVLLFLALSLASFSWGQEAVYKRITIGRPKTVMHVLDSIGIDMECGAVFRNDSLQLELDDHTLTALHDANVKYKVLIEDMSAYYAERAASELPQARAEIEASKQQSRKKKEKSAVKNVGQHEGCDEIDWEIPDNFHLNPNNSPNSFGGCLTYDQVLQELDSMRTLYPHLISLKLDASPTNQTTIEGRTIHYVRISDNPDVDEPNEPETLYQSLVHSREASSLMQLLYFMWYLLENYESDDAIKNLLNNQALYFIPVYNPDGFVYNQTLNPDGGGMQRKNRNVSGGCSTFLDGVDLNRNSAYYWGNGGASSNTCSDTYLGAGPFSENETQIMRDFFLEHDFKLTLNHHSFKNAMLHGYAGTNITNPRPDEYAKYSHDMSRFNRYAYGPSTSISSLNSGNMNDWMLGGPAGVSANGTPTGTGSGKNTLAWTPENGSSSEGGFWPLPSNFVPIAKRAMRMNFLAAFYSGKYAQLHDMTSSNITTTSGDLILAVENLGQTASNFTVSVVPLTGNIATVGADVTESGMTVLEQRLINIDYTLDSGVQPSDTVRFLVRLTNDYTSDSLLYEMEVEKVYQPGLGLLDDPDSDGLANWVTISGNWATTSDAYSGTTAITTTATPPYANNAVHSLELINPFYPEPNEEIVIQFYAKWDLERSFDYVQFEGSNDAGIWVPMCGTYTKSGAPDENNTYSGKNGASNNFQPDLEPLYDGDSGDKWVMEEFRIDASNNAVLYNSFWLTFRFQFMTDESNSQDAYYNADFEGFTFDDFTVFVGEDPQGNVDENEALHVNVYPNPVTESLSILAKNEAHLEIEITNAAGQLMQQISSSKANLQISTNDWSSGVYFVKVNQARIFKVMKL